MLEEKYLEVIPEDWLEEHSRLGTGEKQSSVLYQILQTSECCALKLGFLSIELKIVQKMQLIGV